MEEVLVTREDNIGWITLNRAEKRNTFNVPLAEGLNNALEQLDKDDAVKVIVIQAAGKHFSAGIDLSEFEKRKDEEYREFIALMDRHNHTIATMKKPVIGSVRGYAVANGTGLAAACDITIAADTAKFGTTAIQVGLICLGPASPLEASIGRKRTMELILTGRIIEAKEAERMGFVNRVVPDVDLEEETRKLALELAAKSPLALQAGKIGLYRGEEAWYHQSIDLRGELFADLCRTGDAGEGVRAFLEKREPVWRGE